MLDKYLKNFSANLKRARRNNRLSQIELAHILKITQCHISAYETGRALPSMKTFIKLIHYLKRTPNYFFKDYDK